MSGDGGWNTRESTRQAGETRGVRRRVHVSEEVGFESEERTTESLTISKSPNSVGQNEEDSPDLGCFVCEGLVGFPSFGAKKIEKISRWAKVKNMKGFREGITFSPVTISLHE